MKIIALTEQDRERYEIIHSCIDGDLTNAEAGARLRLTIRHVRRLKRAVETLGEAGVVHGSRGKESPKATKESTKTTIMKFLKEKKHCDFGPTFAQEQLAKQDILIGVETLRILMITQGLWKPRRRRGPSIHRAWRERMGLRGALVQFDGSYHDWFETGKEACLLAAVDDATSTIMHAVFEENEGVHAVFRFWWTYVETHGLPVTIYLDKFSTYKINHQSAVDNPELMTQFERAMKELGVRVICANSPEAKGRIERLFGTLQDRLVKEMRLRDIKDRDAANRFLSEEYLPDHNARFAVVARQKGDAHRILTEEMHARFPAVFSRQEQRTVHNDFTIQFKNRWLQLAATQETTVYKGDVVLVEERLDYTIHVRLKEIYLAYTELPTRPKQVPMVVTALTREKPQWKPPLGHPWRNAAVIKRKS